jgi:hypothetical protein
LITDRCTLSLDQALEAQHQGVEVIRFRQSGVEANPVSEIILFEARK